MPQEKPSDFITNVKEIVNNAGKQRPVSTIVKNVELAATISKLVKPQERPLFKPSDPETATGLVNTGVSQISKSIMTRIEDNENIFRLFPDIELAAQIVISSILSPKDMVKSELIYRTKESVFPPQMTAKLIEIVRAAINTEYKLLDELPDILRQALFESGSCVKAVLPESAVDQLINQNKRITTESIQAVDLFVPGTDGKIRHLGILGDPRPNDRKKPIFAFESAFSSASTVQYEAGFYAAPKLVASDEDFDLAKLVKMIEPCVEVCDNFHYLKMPKLIEKVNEQAIQRLTGSKLKNGALRFVEESYHHFEEKKKTTPKELESMLYKTAKNDYQPFINVPGSLNLSRKSVGKPLVLNIPSEAAIPVHVPGDCSQHVGYFIPIDIDGNPVTIDSVSYDSGQGLSSMLQTDKSNSSLSGLLTEKARRNLGNDGFVPMLDRMTEVYADLIEHDLLERLLKGSYGRKLQISRNNEIYRIMLSRTLQAQMTRLIYVPADYITYFAFNFHRNGTGKSYLDDLSNITSLRAMVLFSKVMAKVKSSITTTSVNVSLDPRDNDPIKTIETAKHLVARARQQYFPHGLNRVVDLTDWIQRAGIEITFDGHPRLPSTKFTFESKNIQHTEPDDSLDEMFRHQTYMHFGLSPETVDSAAKADFATTIENQSILFARRIFMLSNKFSVMMTDYAQKIVSNDESILAALAEVFNEHKGEMEKLMTDEEKELYARDPAGYTSYALQQFIEILELDMPKPDSTRNASQKAAFEAYEEMVDKGLAYIFSEEILPAEFAGKSSEYVTAVKNTWKAHLMRAWMADNNYAPELFDITNTSEDGQPMLNLLDSTKAYSEGIMLNIVSFIESMKAARLAADKDLNRLSDETGTEGGQASDFSSSDGGSSDSGSGEGAGFGDDLGGSDPFQDIGGGGEVPPESGEEEKNPFDDIPQA